MRRLLTYLLFLVPLLIAIEPPVMLAVTTAPKTKVEVEVSRAVDIASWTFRCPLNNDLCKFHQGTLVTQACTNDDWTVTAGADAAMCLHQRFNGLVDLDNEIEVLTTSTHTGGATAQVSFDMVIGGNGAGGASGPVVSMLTSGSAIICAVRIYDSAFGPFRITLLSGTNPIETGTVPDLNLLIGVKYTFHLEYDGTGDTCTINVDPFGVRPGTGSLTTDTAPGSADQEFRIITIENSEQAVLLNVWNVTTCTGGCNY